MMKIDWDQYKGDVEPETLNLFKSALEGEICFSFWLYFQAVPILRKVLVRKQTDLPERLDGNADYIYIYMSNILLAIISLRMSVHTHEATTIITKKLSSSDEKLTIAIRKEYSLLGL